jgi:hypothetical protein
MSKITTTSLLLIAACAVGCATPSQYRPERPGRISVLVDGSWRLRVEGTDVTLEESGWGNRGSFMYPGLANAVGCVPLSKRYAEEAEENLERFNTRNWISLGILAGSLAGGGGLIGYGAAQNNAPALFAGVGTLLAGLIAGIIPAITAVGYGQHATANSLDAINSYNDLYATTPGCFGGPTTAPPRLLPPTPARAPAPSVVPEPNEPETQSPSP